MLHDYGSHKLLTKTRDVYFPVSTLVITIFNIWNLFLVDTLTMIEFMNLFCQK